MSDQPLKLRGVRVDPLADLALPLLLTLHTGLAIGLLLLLVDGLAGRPFLPGLGWWALLFAAESFIFTAYFFVRELDMPWALRGVEAAFMLLLAKWAATAPLTGWGLDALLHLEALSPWAGVLLLGWAWALGSRAAFLCGALHPRLMPDPTLEVIRQNDHGEAFAALRSRVLGLTAAIAVLAGLLPAAGRWMGPGLIALAVIAVAALFVAARLRQQINWALERLVPPEGVLRAWAPQAIALMLLPLILAALLPPLPRLPVEHLFGREAAEGQVGFAPPLEPTPGRWEWVPPELAAELTQRTVAFPPWLKSVALAALAFGVVLVVGLALHVAYQQLAERLGWGGARSLLPLLRALLRWYGALWQALWAGLWGGIRLAAQGTAAVGGALLDRAGLLGLGRYLGGWGRPPGEARAAVRYYFARLQAEAARRGLGRPPGATAAEFTARLSQAAPERAGEIEALTRAYQEARYGAGAVGPEQVSLVRRAWVQIAKALGRR